MRRTTCGGCNRSPLEVILDLGETPLADSFPSNPGETYRTWPLQLAVCVSCWLVQLTEVVPDHLLFGKDYSFFSGSSPSLVTHLKSFAEWAKRRFPDQVNRGVVEIACNDGTLLKEFQQPYRPVLGIDPAGPPALAAREAGVTVIQEAFNSRVADVIMPNNGLVIANNVLAHVADLNDFVAGISTLVNNHGVFVGEFQYLPDLLTGNAFDMVYHEHRSFLSLSSLEPVFRTNGLTITEAHPQKTQGGSMRIVARRSKPGVESANLWSEQWLRSFTAYEGLQGRVEHIRNKLWDLLNERRDKVIAGYAASAKSTTLLNYCGISRDVLPYIVDTTPYKIGKYSPGTDIPIISPEEEWWNHEPADAYLLLVSNYLGGVLRREMKKTSKLPEFIVPLPTPAVI